ncbi:hypothetical protein [Streptomyces sp. NPDC005009]
MPALPVSGVPSDFCHRSTASAVLAVNVSSTVKPVRGKSAAPFSRRHFTYSRRARAQAATSSPPPCASDPADGVAAPPLAAGGMSESPSSPPQPVNTSATTEAATAGSTRFALTGSPALLSNPSADAAGGPTVGRHR